MRIHRVVARAFGPFRDEVLELAPGMTIVAGPNEAGKSSWHAATRLALTGVRRGRGRTTSADAAIAERHRPWDQPDRWEVGARITLDDGREIDIHQDLAGKVACEAIDIGLGRPVSDEIMDGTPDASRWLGLDRDAFAATVSVNQAEIMAVADAAEQLQEQMQRAAATRGTDATAAQAIDRLAEFRREAVGADTVAAKGPLRTARRRLEEATNALAEARQLHAAYLERAERSEQAERAAVDARRALAVANAAAELGAARRVAARSARVAELAARHPQRPPGLAERDALADRVAAALDAWAHRPAPIVLEGPTSEELSAELASLPELPVGDLTPDPAIAAQVREVERIDDALRTLGERPATGDPVARGDVDVARSLARRLRAVAAAQPIPDSAEPALPRQGLPPIALLAVGGLLIVVAILATVALGPVPGIALVAAGLVAMAAAWRSDAAGRAERGRAAAADAVLAPYRAAAARALEERRTVEMEATSRGWPADADGLEALADRLAVAAAETDRVADWTARRAALADRREASIRALGTALAARGVEGTHDPLAGWDAYRTACLERARQAELAARAEPLRRALDARLAAEESRDTMARAEAGAIAALREAGSEAQVVSSGSADELIRGLQAWQERRGAALAANQVAIEEWRELQGLLDGRTVEQLRTEAEDRRASATRSAAGLEPASIEALAGMPDLARLVDERRAHLASVERTLHELHGALETIRATLPDVSAAEEDVAAARAELDRVTGLADVVDRTLALLGAAQDRVHRDLAPILAGAVARWLPRVSGGAYDEVSVDPADLSVKVKESGGGPWREARLLSAGTREQIYLLLRVAMAEHLVTTGETAPLLLDEVTAQADADRREGLLAVLHALSGERQIVLFSHDEAVAAWAEQHLVAPNDRLVRLPGRGAPRQVGIPIGAAAPSADGPPPGARGVDAGDAITTDGELTLRLGA